MLTCSSGGIVAYWWVSQNKTYKHERAGGFLWAPLADKSGAVPFHWATMGAVRPGDVIFSYIGQFIRSVSLAVTSAYESTRPFKDDSVWLDAGRRIDVQYEDLKPSFRISEALEKLLPLLPAKYSPLSRDGAGNQGYLFPLPPRAGRLLLQLVGRDTTSRDSDPVSSAITDAPLKPTERDAIIKSRVGQGPFRDALMDLWQSRCCVTGLSLPRLLRASHIKPWRDANNAERLDRFNGLLLSPAYDAAFDAGYISFRTDGRLLISSALNVASVKQLGLTPEAKIEHLTSAHVPYLEYHEQEVLLVKAFRPS
jgi:hypothetical protein